MGAGAFPAGVGPAGHDPPAAASLDPQQVPAAARFELFGQTFPLDASGQLANVHPVDQAVALALGMEIGSVAAVPTLGLDVARLKRTRRDAMQSAVNDVVRAALQSLIAAGDIRLIGSPLAENANGRPWFYVDYINLRLPQPAQRRVSRTG